MKTCYDIDMKRYISNLSINMLLVMDAVCRHKNMHLAAEELGMTQPAISKSLKRLAEVTGKELFVRESRNLVVTDEGKKFWEKSLDILSMCEELLDDQEDVFDPTLQAKQFTIAIPSVDAGLFIKKLVIDLPKKYPLINVDLITAAAPDAYALVESGQADLYIGYLSDRISKSMSSEKICDLAFSLIANDQFKKPLTKEDFGQAEHLFVHRQYHDSALDNKLIELGLMQNNIKRIPDNEHLSEVLLHSDCIYLATKHKASNILEENKELRTVDTAFDLPEIPLHQIWLNKHSSGASHKWLRNYTSNLYK